MTCLLLFGGCGTSKIVVPSYLGKSEDEIASYVKKSVKENNIRIAVQNFITDYPNYMEDAKALNYYHRSTANYYYLSIQKGVVKCYIPYLARVYNKSDLSNTLSTIEMGYRWNTLNSSKKIKNCLLKKMITDT